MCSDRRLGADLDLLRRLFAAAVVVTAGLAVSASPCRKFDRRGVSVRDGSVVDRLVLLGSLVWPATAERCS